jgi:hypothetical protein
MLDEYCTSKLCNKCECEVKNEYKRNITDKKSVRGLVYCKNKLCVQELKLKNKDNNSVLNMKKIVRNLIRVINVPFLILGDVVQFNICMLN